MCVTVVVWSLVKMLSQKKVRGTSEIGTVASQKTQFTGRAILSPRGTRRWRCSLFFEKSVPRDGPQFLSRV